MDRPQMHEGQARTDVDMVRRLLASQFPRLSRLPITQVDSFGTDHDVYRLGEDMAVRLPIVEWATAQAAKEARWLPQLAPLLPLRLPAHLGLGDPGFDYPFTWSVVEWLPGEDAANTDLGKARAAEDLAAFVIALREAPTDGAPPRPKGARGSPLSELDAPLRVALEQLAARVDTKAVERVWDKALEADAHHGPEVWIHGDLLPGNLLVQDKRLTAVIDFGGLNVGDPACDLQPAWALFDARSREVYREALNANDAAWLRGRGWSVCQAVMALPYYWDTNPGIVRQSWHILSALGIST